MIVAVYKGQHLAALASVSPGQEDYFPELMDVNHVERTEYPAAAWN